MNRKEKIFQYLSDFGQVQTDSGKSPETDSGFLAAQLGLDRSNVSRDLNELEREGRVIKLQGRPVKFTASEFYREPVPQKQEKAEFQFMIGENGSLKTQIEQGKSAVLYPPNGLHTLLAGPTGTGKTTFAEKLFQYAKAMKVMKENAGFIVFNCAEYAQNQELILSQLFGHRKGAFTGADKDKPGLVEKADGGILFLDEIHRLPPYGQEMLFLLMDKGCYRRLGETEELRKASVLIIGATTENLNTTLLKTFLRRMPVVIHLPALEQRPLIERLRLIEEFFSAEQKKIGAPIQVYKDVVIALLLYACPGNIGQLSADIQLLCARAFLEYKVKQKDVVEINFEILPPYIQNGRLESPKRKSDLIEFLQYSEDYHMFIHDQEGNGGSGENLYIEISEKYEKFLDQGRSGGEISNLIEDDLEQYMNHLLKKYNMKKDHYEKKNLLKIIDAKVYYAVEDILQFAEIKLGRKMPERIKVGIAMHVNAMTERISKGMILKEKELHDIVLNHPQEFQTAKVMLRLLEEELSIQVPEQEIGYFTMFLCAMDEETIYQKIAVIVMTHGESTASSMAEVANKLLNTDHCRAVDMPLDVPAEEALEKAVALAEEIDEGKGVLVLADMGSLLMFSEMIEKRTGIPVRSVPMVSTIMVIEAVRKAMLRGAGLEKLAKELTQIGKVFDRQGEGKQKIHTIIVTCFTGQGTALKLAEIIRDMIPAEKQGQFRIRCMDFEGTEAALQASETEELPSADAVVGTVNLELPGVPFISVDRFVMGDGISRLNEIIQGGSEVLEAEPVQEPAMDEKLLAGTLDQLLYFLNPKKMAAQAMEALREAAKDLHVEIDKELTVRYVIHLCCMLERLIQEEVLPNKDTERLRREYGQMFRAVERSLSPLADCLHLKIPDSETAYLVEMLLEEF